MNVKLFIALYSRIYDIGFQDFCCACHRIRTLAGWAILVTLHRTKLLCENGGARSILFQQAKTGAADKHHF